MREPLRGQAGGTSLHQIGGLAVRLSPAPGLTGAWRSLVAHLTGGQGVGGSNPLAPTNDYNDLAGCRVSCGAPP